MGPPGPDRNAGTAAVLGYSRILRLTAAYLAAQRAGDLSRGILVLNPEPTLDHVLPDERDGELDLHLLGPHITPQPRRSKINTCRIGLRVYLRR